MTNLNPMSDDSKIDDQNADFEGDSGSKPPLNQLSKNQKIATASLAVFAVLIVILWSAQLKNNIYGPLNSGSTGTNEAAQLNNQAASDLALKNKDTDSDGLSDYDELNLYKTSPYLEDSDGDTIKDGDEVKNGTDPNCPTGRICASSELDSSAGTGSSAPAASTDTLNNILNQYNTVNSAAGSASQPAVTGSLTAKEKEMLKSIDVASLRQLLLENGMDKATLDKISDKDLMQSYSETLQ